MGLTRKTTIRFPPDLHAQLTRRAEIEGTSLGELVRRACRERYGIASLRERSEAVGELAALRLPVAETGEMKRQSVPNWGRGGA